MDKLIEDMKRLLADVYAYGLKAQNYHWNVEGPNFMEYHALFADVYNKASGDVDTVAEHIRALDAYAPGSLGRFKELTSIQDETTIPVAIVQCLEPFARTLTSPDSCFGTRKVAVQDP